MKPETVSLVGNKIYLEPMSIAHLEGLTEVGIDPTVWKFTVNQIGNGDQMKAYVRDALDDNLAGKSLPFVTRLIGSNKIVGSTRFGNIDTANRKVEIGWTWVAPEWQRTAVNTEAKLLMLAHAFEVWQCVRVEFKTDAANIRSRNAILRIGAVEEGILRRHMITEAGRLRDTVYFSILDDEWPAVKDRLTGKLSRYK